MTDGEQLHGASPRCSNTKAHIGRQSTPGNGGDTLATNEDGEPLECFGDVISEKGRGPGKRTHDPAEIERTAFEGEDYWTCPECGWLLKEFMGVHVDDV